MSENFGKQRILKNSFLLYIRMLFTMWLNLYATRLTLANLGVEDMGVYGVVGSIVSLFSVFTSGLTNAVQRFITFEIGLKNGNPNKVFCSSLNVIFILSVVMVILIEAGGLWMLENKVNIPDSGRVASFWVFQLSVLTCIVNTISIPYNALIIAHEKINVFATISIIQVVLNFLSAYYLGLFINNRLLIYAILLAAVSIFVRILYQVYCHKKFAEATYHFIIDWKMIRQIGKFTGVVSTSGIMGVISSQGIAFVINITFGVAINAVYNIALQLKNSVLSFSLNILKAISPQITKTYANNELDLYKKLVISGSKLEVFLIYIIIMPFLFRTDYIMKLWLGNVPEYTVVFVQCTVMLSLTYAAFDPIRIGVLATNNIIKFMLIPDAIYMLVLPLGYIVGNLSNSPSYFIKSIVAFEIIVCGIRILYASRTTIFRKKELVTNILLPCLFVALTDGAACGILSYILPTSLLGLITLVFINCVCLVILVFLCGLSKIERNQMKLVYIKFRNSKKTGK